MSDKDKTDERKPDIQKSPISVRKAKKLTKLKEYLSKQESLKNSRKVSHILKKKENDRTEDEKKTLTENDVIVKRIHKNKERRLLLEQRVLETEDNEEALQAKCGQLAAEIMQSKQTVIYTGAGISTAASIPDYRGPQGVWTLLQKGEQLIPQDLSDAEPTVTHMCITALQKKGHIAHVVSQNCDGLHVRSGLPRKVLSEVHGNMYIEICNTCKPHREYVRLFDVTENTGVRRHQTGRKCKICGGELRDTIVHFGEKGGVRSPYRWKEAVKAANGCDLILCLGSSLKILKKYSCLWCMDRARNKRPKLVIINLQWTPKDSDSFLKIHGRCDDVLQRVMKILNYDIPQYSRDTDPIFLEAISLEKGETNSISKKTLDRPEALKHVPLNTMPRSPTPSLSSESDYSASSVSSSDDSDLTESDTDDVDEDDDDVVVEIIPPKDNNSVDRQLLQQEQLLTYYANGKSLKKESAMERELDITSIISKVKGRIQQETDVKKMSKEELNMLRSERICNQAKVAMQLKTPTADTCEDVKPNMPKDERFKIKSEKICNEAKTAMQRKTLTEGEAYKGPQGQVGSQHVSGYPGHQQTNINKNGVHKSYFIQDSTQGPYSAVQNNPVSAIQDESVTSHEEKLKYLQTLQSQLQALKQKQQILKQDGPIPHENVKVNKLSNSQHPDTDSLAQTKPVGLVKNVWNQAAHRGEIQPTNGPYPTAIVKHIKHEPQTHTDVHNSAGNMDSQQQIADYLVNKQTLTNTLIEKQQKQISEYLANEQLVTNDLIDKQHKQFEKEKTDMKHQQENDHRRMYQQFVMQVQVAESTNLGEQKKGEMLQVFQMQQKLMLNKQTAQLQELFNKHQAQQKALIDEIEKRRKTFIDSIQLSNPVITEPKLPHQDQQTFVTKMDDPYQSQYQSQLHLSVSPGSNPGMFSPSQGARLISPQAMISPGNAPVMYQDRNTGKLDALSHHTQNNSHIAPHQITPPHQQPHYEQGGTSGGEQIQVNSTNSRVNQYLPTTTCANQTSALSMPPSIHVDTVEENNSQTKIPGFSELVEGILTCESCAFLKQYGMSKRTCSNCDNLKLRYGIVQKPSLAQSSNSLNNQLTMTKVSLPSFSCMSGGSQASCQGSHIDGQFATTVAHANVSHIPMDTQSYLGSSHISGQGSNLPDSNTHFFPVMDLGDSRPGYLGQSQSIDTTSSVTTGHLDCPDISDQELSPVIPYTSNRVNTSTHSVTSTHIQHSEQTNQPLQTNSRTIPIDSGLPVNISTQPMSMLTNEINETGAIAVKIEMSETDADYAVQANVNNIVKTEEDIQVKTEIDNMVKPDVQFRPRSQSEILQAEEHGVDNGTEKRQVRSYSYSEHVMSDARLVNEESGVVGKETVETEVTAAKIGKKRKSSTNVSVPGWFGKGLNLKKKRKY